MPRRPLGAQLKRGKCCHNAHLVVSNAPYKLMPFVATPFKLADSLLGISDAIMSGRKQSENDALTLTHIKYKTRK